MLSISEQLLILAHNEDGRLIAGDRIAFFHALAGAVLAELLLDDCLRLDQDSRVGPGARTPAGQVGREAVGCVRSANRTRDLTWWIGRLCAGMRLRQLIVQQLVDGGHLREERRRVLGILRTRRYPCADPEARQRVSAQLRVALLGDDEVEIRMRALIAMAHAAGLVGTLMPLDSPRAQIAAGRAERLSQVGEHDDVLLPCAKAVTQAIADARAALAASVD